MHYQTKSPRCLGIANTDWGVVVKPPRGYLLIAEGLIQTPANLPTGDRYLHIYQTLTEVVATQNPKTLETRLFVSSVGAVWFSVVLSRMRK